MYQKYLSTSGESVAEPQEFVPIEADYLSEKEIYELGDSPASEKFGHIHNLRKLDGKWYRPLFHNSPEEFLKMLQVFDLPRPIVSLESLAVGISCHILFRSHDISLILQDPEYAYEMCLSKLYDPLIVPELYVLIDNSRPYFPSAEVLAQRISWENPEIETEAIVTVLNGMGYGVAIESIGARGKRVPKSKAAVVTKLTKLVNAPAFRPKKKKNLKNSQRTKAIIKKTVGGYVSSKKPVQQTIDLVRQMADPVNSQVHRIPSKGRVVPTCLSKTSEVIIPDFDGGNNNLWAAISDQKERAAVFKLENGSTLTYKYVFTAAYITGGDLVNVTTIDLAAFQALFNNFDRIPLPLVIATATSAYKPHGPIMFAGSCQTKSLPGMRFFFLNVNDTVTFVLNATSTNAYYLLTDYYVDNTITTGEAALNATSVVYTAAAAGYYAFSIQARGTANSLTGKTMTVTLDSPASLPSNQIAHKAMVDLGDNLYSVQSSKWLASSFRVQNNASMTKDGGSVVMAQDVEDQDWTTAIIKNDPALFIPGIPDYKEMSFINGAYMYLKPGSEDSFKTNTSLKLDGNLVADSCYAIERANWAYMAITFEAADSKNYLMESCHSIEFQSRNKFFEAIKPDFQYVAVLESLDIIKDAPQFMENPTHGAAIMTSIKNFFSKAAGFVTQYAPGAIAIAKAIGSFI